MTEQSAPSFKLWWLSINTNRDGLLFMIPYRFIPLDKKVIEQYYNPECQASETFHSIEKSIDRPSVSGASRGHLVNDGYYYNQEQNVLQHYRFPELFIRRTKAVYISVANDEIIGIAKAIEKVPPL